MYKIKHISPSAGATFDRCNMQWKYKYINELPWPSSPQSELGKTFEEAAHKAWSTKAHAHKDQQVEAMLKALFTSKNAQDIVNTKIKHRQFKVDCPCGDTKLLGFIDQIMEDDSVIDVKTSKSLWTEDKVKETEQHLAYPYGVWKMGLITTFPIIFKYLIVTTSDHPQVQILTYKVSKEALLKYEQKFMERSERMKMQIELDVFPTNKAYHCGYCPFRSICPAHQ